MLRNEDDYARHEKRQKLKAALLLWFLLVGLALLLWILLAGCQPRASCAEPSECPTVAVGTVDRLRGDTLILVTGVGHALRLDTVVVRPGLIVRVSDCGH